MREYGRILAIVLGLAGAAQAQEAAPEQPASDGLGHTLGTAAAPGKPYVRDTFGAWEVRCVDVAEGKAQCQLYQLLHEAGGNPVAEVSFQPLPPGNPAVAGATIMTPLETLLQPQLRLQIDGSEARLYPFSFCTRGGCISRLGFTAPELSEFEKGTKATLTIRAMANPQEPVVIEMSLEGFTAGYDALFN